jgi:hypothetical protein
MSASAPNMTPGETTREESHAPVAANENPSFERCNIAFNTPDRMNVDETVVIELRLSPKETVAELQAKVVGPGPRVGQSIKVTDVVAATLSGSPTEFKITAMRGDLPQEVDAVEGNEWKWEVTPISSGRHQLSLTIQSVVNRGKVTASHTKSFDRDILVEVSLGHQLAGMLGGSWQWLWSAFLVPLYAYVEMRFRARKSTGWNADRLSEYGRSKAA